MCPVYVLYVGVHMYVRVNVPCICVVCGYAHVCEGECALAACVEAREKSCFFLYHLPL